VGFARIDSTTPFEAKVKTLTYDNGKDFYRYAKIDEAMGIKG
jgi:IS30 family transposase